jgi:polysaccharide export outer membrane protein
MRQSFIIHSFPVAIIKAASIIQIGVLLLLFMGSTACNLKRKYIYFNNSGPGYKTAPASFSPQINIGDRLEIKIAGLEPQSSLPFSFSSGPVQPTTGENPAINYLVNSNGEVSIPVLGPIPVAGLQLEQAEALIRNKLIDLIKSPVVSVRISNFMISVLGEVKLPGYYRVTNNRITILEIIAMAGDITINGDRKSVIVWRKEAGETKPYEIDLTTTAIFQSPVFELRQNDVVYIKPNKSGLLQPTLFRTAAPILLSIGSIGISILILLLR